MPIIPDTLVKLPNGREGVVISPSIQYRDHVLVKVKGGRKSWFNVEDCTPVFSHEV